MAQQPQNPTKVSFDALLDLTLQEYGRAALAALPSPAALRQQYPATARWDARLHKALAAQKRPRRPARVLKKALLAAAVVVLALACALAASADARTAAYELALRWLPGTIQVEYTLPGGYRTALPTGYTDHYVLPGYQLLEETQPATPQGFAHSYIKYGPEGTENLYIVECWVLQPEDSMELDQRNTQWTTTMVNGAQAQLGISTAPGVTDYTLIWERDGVQNVVYGINSMNALLKIARGIY